MRNDRNLALGLLCMGAKGTRTLMLLGRPIGLAFGVGLAAIGTAHALVPLATFNASLEVFGNSGGGSTPGSYSIDNFCNTSGCGSASAVMTSNVAGEQTTSGSALSSLDIGANSSIDVVYYFTFVGPAGGTVDYHWSASGSTSVFGGGAAFAHLYKWALGRERLLVFDRRRLRRDRQFFRLQFSICRPRQHRANGRNPVGGEHRRIRRRPYTATIDPMITIDPSSAAEGYSLVLSPNVTQESLGNSVPEPATWVMALTGFAALGFAYRVRRRAPVVRRRG
jgi:hypothetical protein